MKPDLYAITDAFNSATLIATDLSHAFGKKVPVRIFTDSKKVFGLINRGKQSTEKRLAIDISATREAYRRLYIGNARDKESWECQD